MPPHILLLTLLLLAPTLPSQQPPWTLGPFLRPLHTPVIAPNPASTFTDPLTGNPVHWESLHTFNPAAIVRNGRIYVLYRAEDDSGSTEIGAHTSRLGLAESSDGLHFTRLPAPVLFPAHDAQEFYESPGGVEDPRLVESPDGAYILTYTQWARTRDVFTVGIATSPDLIHWTKQGPAFGSTGRYATLKYKSAAILTQRVGDRLIAARLHGKFWMYWGEVQIRLATSPDLIHWTPVEDAHGAPIVLMHARPNLFDSAFPESGPPPILTKDGIVMLYNAKNATVNGAPNLAPGTYATGQALFSPQDPTHLLARPGQPFFQPREPFEKAGQYTAGTTFSEGLVFFHNKWFLYYGCADSLVGVAIYDPSPPLPARR